MSGLLKLSFYKNKSVIQSKKNIMDFNEKLQQLRTKSGLTQEQLAEKYLFPESQLQNGNRDEAIQILIP